MAMWSSQASGSSDASARSAVTLTLTAGIGAADLYPGFSHGGLFFTTSNTNPYPVTFDSMTSGTVTSSDPDDCPASNVTVADATGLNLVVPAGAAAQPGSIADAASMDMAAPDGCQGAVFTVAVTLSGAQT